LKFEFVVIYKKIQKIVSHLTKNKTSLVIWLNTVTIDLLFEITLLLNVRD